ncbi:alpha-L-rhamnosidase N-terminal domain-containing protein [Streptomyces sp. cg40]|uniref:alpha-L-rhamnosidase-related protein n=1 Tax=Streptomyces sp. cg40 TaxID=3419764 RepID=UPI003CFD56D6
MPSAPQSAAAASPRPTVPWRAVGWRGHWIGHPDDVVEPGRALPPRTDGSGGLVRQLFRTTCELESVPARVPARLTADSRYVLFVNGEHVGRGPVRSQPRRMRYDEYDLSPHLRPGSNTVTVLVTYYGDPNAFWQPAVPNATLGRHATLVFEADLGDIWLTSDGSWTVRRVAGLEAAPPHGFHGIPVELVDARRLSADWLTRHEGPDWRPTRLMRAGHMGALARSQPPTDPYGALLPRPIGALEETALTARTYWCSEEIAFAADLDHPVSRVTEFFRQRGDVPREAATAPVRFRAEPGTARLVTVDFGRVVCGLVGFPVTAPRGTRIDILHQEKDVDPFKAGLISNITGARYIARGDDDAFEALEVSGLRLVRLLVTSERSGDVVIGEVGVRERLYPIRGAAYFRSSDGEMDRLYAAGRRTVTLNAQDAFTDCPTREQRAWVGDGVVHQLVHLTTSTDWSLARWYLELANSPREDGLLPRSVVGEMEYLGGTTIPDWALSWVHGVHNLYRYEGLSATVRELLPSVERVLRWYLPYRNGHGVLEHVPEWNLVDWSAVFLTGTSSILTAMWARALREFADISAACGNAGNAAWARALWEQARAGFEVFWDPGRETYVDHLVDGVRQLPASQLAGATAIVSGLAPAGRWDAVADWISDPKRLVVRSWIGGDDGGYDDTKIADQLRGVRNVTWDARDEVVRAEPFASHLVHESLALCGRKRELADALRDWSQFLTDGYDTFGECWGWGTPAHGWSSTPTSDIVRHLLGIEPDESGFLSARIRPAFGVISEMSGAAPTPYGLLHVRVSGTTCDVDSPVPFTFRAADGTTTTHRAGRVVLD